MNKKPAPSNIDVPLPPEFKAGTIMAVPTLDLLKLLDRAVNTMDPLEQPDWVWKLLHPIKTPIDLSKVDPVCLVFFSTKE